MRGIIFLLVMLFGTQVYAKEYIVYHKAGVITKQDARAKKHLRHIDASVIDLSDDEAKALKAKGVKISENKKMHVLGHKSVVSGMSAKDISRLISGNTPWGIQAVQARVANVVDHIMGAGVHVCVVDTGIDYTHPDLAGRLYGGSSFVTGTPTDKTKKAFFDDNGHGTHVSGTIAGIGAPGGVFGVAPQAQIYAVKVLDKDGNGDYAGVADGLLDCIGHSKVVNMSLGGPDDSPVLKDAVNKVLKAGLIIIAAAGNESGPVGYPAKYPGVHAVSAIDVDHTFASFSDYGPEINFAAPGIGITSTIPGGGYDTWDGTSMASPHVAGVVALMLSAHKPRAMADKLTNLTDIQQGRGLINAKATVEAK